MASSASSISAGKFIDAISCLESCVGMQADAQQAYTQSELGGHETWVFLPRDQWPAEWHVAGYKNPVCKLRLALYGHPLAGAFWERHCTKQLKSVGFTPIPTWENCFVHREFKTVLMVYVDDFKMAGKEKSINECWKRIKDVINHDEPAPLGKFLGCGHSMIDVDPQFMKPHFDAVQSFLRDGSENLQSLKERDRELGETQTRTANNADTVAVAGGVKRKTLRGIQYEMAGFLQ